MKITKEILSDARYFYNSNPSEGYKEALMLAVLKYLKDKGEYIGVAQLHLIVDRFIRSNNEFIKREELKND